MAQTSQVCTYDPASSVVFLKTKERFGGLSNMAPGFPLNVNGIRIRTSEALYQACRFPNRPDVQRRIIEERSPMTAKMRSKAFRKESRSDWDAVRVKIMRWCLRVKLAQNWNAFRALLLKTGNRPIVEQSRKDDFWGAKRIDEHTLVGMNVLGQLLMELRELVKAEGRMSLLLVQPLTIADFKLAGGPIEIVTGEDEKVAVSMACTAPTTPHSDVDSLAVLQQALFDTTVVEDTTPPTHPAAGKNSVRITDLIPYPDYKESELTWLDNVPAHWEVRRGKCLFHCIDVRSPTGEEELLTVSSERGVVPRSSATVTMFKAESYIGYKLCWPGDLVINSLWAWAGGLGVSPYHGIISSAYGVYRLRYPYQMYSNYIHRLVRSTPFNLELRVRSKGIWISRLQLTDEAFLNAPFPVPPVEEQTAIVRFLDHADRRIWRYIRAKQKLIALLEEQKQAIIHQAVTGQIDVRTGQPYPAYKPSGVEWLREVTEHWDVFRLATICNKITNGYVGPTRDILVSDGVRYLQSLHIKRNQIQFDGKYFVEESWSRAHAKSILMEGDVLVVQTGDIGQVAVVPREFEGSNCHALIILSCRPSYASGQFVSLVLNSNYGFHSLNLIKTGALHPHLNCTFVREIHIALPPLNAQHTIATYLNRETAIIDALIEKIKKAIALLREYRTSLIADVVTGKLDVREAAAALPEVDSRAADDSLDDTFDADAELPLDELDATLEEANI